MKYIYNYIEHSLNESFNSKEAKKQFVDTGLISKRDYTIIKKAFLPKYVYWGCRERANPENKDIVLDSIYDVTLWFEKSKQYLKSKDLYSYTYEEIRLLMNDPSIGPKKKKTKGQGKYKIFYEDDKGNIAVHVKDHAASVYWAHKYKQGEVADGQWCTAAYSTDDNFKIYSESGPIFIFILPNEHIEEQQRVCQAFGQPFVEYDVFSIEEVKSKKVDTLDSIKSETEPIYYNASDDVIESFPSTEKTSIILKTTEKYLKQTVTIIAKEQKKFKFNIKDIKDINLYFLLSFGYNESDEQPAANILGPYKEDIINFYRENILEITNKNISTFDKKYKFFYKIDISGRDYMYASTVEIGNKYNLKYRQHGEWEIPDLINVKSLKNISRDEMLSYFNISENPLDLFDKSFIKKYNIRFEINKDDFYKDNIQIEYSMLFDIKGLDKNFKYVESGWEQTLDISSTINHIDKNLKNLIEILDIQASKDIILKIKELGFDFYDKIVSGDFNKCRVTFKHEDKKHSLLFLQVGRNEKDTMFQMDFYKKPELSEFIKYFESL